MRNFILGVIVTIVVLFVVVIIVAEFGLMPTNADATPPAFESRIAMNAVDNAIERHAPRANNPVPATDDNLIDGMKTYTMNCALCHGTLDYKPSPLEHSLYPPPPQLVLAPMDDPEWRTYYAIRSGIRYTGMPAWNKALDDQEMWKLTGFLTRIEKLPPAVKEFWKKTYGVEPRAASEHEGHEGHEH